MLNAPAFRSQHLGAVLVPVLVTALAAILVAPAAADDLKVVITIKPIHSLAMQVMDGAGTPVLLVDGAASPHSFSLKPSGAKAINTADVFIRVSEAIEPFTGRIAKALPKSVALVTLDEIPGLTLLDRRTSATFETHEYHDEDGAEHADHDDDNDEHGGKDGHIWLDPANAKKIVSQIAAVLSEKQPVNAATFKANAEKANARIDAMSAEIAKDMGPLAGKGFIVFHDAYQYFEKSFGLAAAGSITVSPEAQPSVKRLSAIRKKVADLGATCVFSEPAFQPKLVATVTEGTAARAGTLDPEGMTLEKGPGLYEALMRGLAKNLRSCLTPTS